METTNEDEITDKWFTNDTRKDEEEILTRKRENDGESEEKREKTFDLLAFTCEALDLPPRINVNSKRILEKTYSIIAKHTRGAMVETTVILACETNDYPLANKSLKAVLKRRDHRVPIHELMVVLSKARRKTCLYSVKSNSRVYLRNLIKKFKKDQLIRDKQLARGISDKYYPLVEVISNYILTKTLNDRGKGILVHEKGDYHFVKGRFSLGLASAAVVGADKVIATVHGNKWLLFNQRRVHRLANVSKTTIKNNCLTIKPLVENMQGYAGENESFRELCMSIWDKRSRK
jgi:hypothetical protein